ncbi:MAG: hypothetical protein QOH01_3139 [Verrucomicrobiota bacterium]
MRSSRWAFATLLIAEKVWGVGARRVRQNILNRANSCPCKSSCADGPGTLEKGDRRCESVLLFAPAFAVNQVVERFDSLLTQICAKLHIAADAEVAIVLFLDSAHVRVVTFVTQLTILIPRPVAPHSWSIVRHSFESLLWDQSLAYIRRFCRSDFAASYGLLTNLLRPLVYQKRDLGVVIFDERTVEYPSQGTQPPLSAKEAIVT